VKISSSNVVNRRILQAEQPRFCPATRQGITFFAARAAQVHGITLFAKRPAGHCRFCQGDLCGRLLRLYRWRWPKAPNSFFKKRRLIARLSLHRRLVRAVIQPWLSLPGAQVIDLNPTPASRLCRDALLLGSCPPIFLMIARLLREQRPLMEFVSRPQEG